MCNNNLVLISTFIPPSLRLELLSGQGKVLYAKVLQAPLLKRFNHQDLDNNAAATKFLTNSLDPDLRSELRRKVDSSDSFAIIELKLVHLLVTRSIMRFERIKTTIRSLHPQQYPGENIESLSNDFCKHAKELESAGQYDHSLTLNMIKAFLMSSVQGLFSFVINSMLLSMHSAITTVAFMTKVEANKHMVLNKLTFREVCQVATELYRTANDDNEWPPAKLPQDSHRVPQGKAFSLAQGTYSKTDIISYECNQPGHMKRDCPKLTSKSKGKSGKKSAPSDKKKTPWRKVPPSSGQPSPKSENGKQFNWCCKCKFWTTTHTTATHTGGKTAATSDGANLLSLEKSDEEIRQIEYRCLPQLYKDKFTDLETDWSDRSDINVMSDERWQYEVHKIERRDKEKRSALGKLERKYETSSAEEGEIPEPSGKKKVKFPEKLEYQGKPSWQGEAKGCDLCKGVGIPERKYMSHETAKYCNKKQWELKLSGNTAYQQAAVIHQKKSWQQVAKSEQRRAEKYKTKVKELRREIRLVQEKIKKKRKRSVKRNSSDSSSSSSSSSDDSDSHCWWQVASTTTKQEIVKSTVKRERDEENDLQGNFEVKKSQRSAWV